MIEPTVRLIAFTPKPFDTAVASARTCYSPRVVMPEEITEKQRESIGKSIWEAGHHTPFQHAAFTFSIENVSRQFVWSFLHSHPYYNSDQNSQRYVPLKEVNAFIPNLSDMPRKTYVDAVNLAWDAYRRLTEELKQEFSQLTESIGKVKGLNEKQINADAEKKAIETARYVLPVAALTSLYHTISGVTLMRYARMMNACDCPNEARIVVGKMMAEVGKIDPAFTSYLQIKPLPRKEEESTFNESFNAEFDAALGEYSSKLVSFNQNGEEIVADGVREALGKTKAEMSDDEAIDLAINPARNELLLDTINCWQHSPVMRALNLVSYSFKKKLSHTADSQNQRHRTTPASRPLLTRVHTKKPDCVLPKAILSNSDLKKEFNSAADALWEAKNKLIDEGVPAEYAIYLLPNATALRFTETGRFIDLMHKWRMRTCFNAQEEIYRLSMDELTQVSSVHPRLTRFVGPPCFFRRGFFDRPCPEGPRWCGIEVWRNFPKVIRPF